MDVDPNRDLERLKKHSEEEVDPFGFDDTPSPFARVTRALVPQWLAQRSIRVAVSTDSDVYEVGDSVEITVEITNRLPVATNVVTDGPRVWGWTVDGQLEASDEPRYESDRSNSLDMSPHGTKRFDVTWDGRFKRTGSPTRWVEPEPGEHEIGGFVPTPGGATRDSTTVEFRRSL